MNSVWINACSETIASYRKMIDALIGQLSDVQLHERPAPEMNSVAVILRHLGGNLQSRWTDFLTTDGEKPDRDRDSEFLDWDGDRLALINYFNAGFNALTSAIEQINDSNIDQTIYIRGEPHSIPLALTRSITHLSYHVGQIAIIARTVSDGEWNWLTIPPGGSAKHNEETWGKKESRGVFGHEPPQSINDIRNAYNLAADAYAEKFLDELQHKPRDIELLQEFALQVGAGQRVLDLGCGPGHTTAHLATLGLDPIGIDLSPEMIAKAKTLFPEVSYKVGDFFQLSDPSDSVSGVLAFYCIVHLRSDQLSPVLGEMLRVLKPGGVLLLSFHIGAEYVHVDNFLETEAELDFFPYPVAEVESALNAAGFVDMKIHQRPPYDTEYPTTRCYICAYKPKSP